jgi:hypothetical protein
MIMDALAIPIKKNRAVVVLSDEKQKNASNNLCTTVPIIPHVDNRDDPNTNGRIFGDILVVQNANLPADKFPTNNNRSAGPSARAIVERFANMSKLWNDALENFLQHLTQGGNNGSSYFFVDVHVSANSAQRVESASNSKMVQYNSAWNQFRRNITHSQDSLMTRYKQINHSRNGQPQIYALGINYDGYLDTHARDFMHHLSAIKYPVGPNYRSYMPSRAIWINHNYHGLLPHKV